MLQFNTTNHISLIILTLLTALPIHIQGREHKLISQWAEKPITIDGIADEWQDADMFVKPEKYSAGFRNDNDFLYVSLKIWDRMLQVQVIRFGLTVKLETDKKKSGIFGIEFPRESKKASFVRSRSPQQSKKFPDEILIMANSSLGVIGPSKKEKKYLQTAQAELIGITVRIDSKPGELCYELKVPLRSNDTKPYAINIDTTSTIRINFETPHVDWEALRREKGAKRGSGMKGGGMRGGSDELDRGMGGMGKGGGGMRGSGGGGMPTPERLRLRVKLTLAPGQDLPLENKGPAQ